VDGLYYGPLYLSACNPERMYLGLAETVYKPIQTYDILRYLALTSSIPRYSLFTNFRNDTTNPSVRDNAFRQHFGRTCVSPRRKRTCPSKYKHVIVNTVSGRDSTSRQKGRSKYIRQTRELNSAAEQQTIRAMSYSMNTTASAPSVGGGGKESNVMLRQQIRNRNLEVIGTDIDAKVCTYWCNAISEGLKTFDDFERSMVQSSQYEKRVLSLFKNASFELLGSNGFDPRLFDEFVRSNRNRKHHVVVTPDTVDSYIRDTKAFRLKYVPLIKSVAMLTVDRELQDNDVEAYFQKFRRDTRYDVEAFKKDLSTSSEPVKNEISDDDDDTDANYEAVMRSMTVEENQPRSSAVGASATAPATSTASSAVAHPNKNKRSPPGATAAASKTSSSVIASESQMRLRKRPIVSQVKEVLRAFFEVNSRPMFVQEYLRFSEHHALADVSANTSVERWKEAFEEEKPTLCAMMNVISSVHTSFIGSDITGYSVIDRYLHLFDQAKESTEKLYDTVKAELVKTDDYELAMSAKLGQVYAETYSMEMSGVDVKFVFDKVREASVALDDDEVNNFVRKFKDDMDTVTDNICNTYMAVYDRVPDTSELTKHVTDYRSRLTCLSQIDDLNREVESALVSGLEFHDVLKSKIKQKHVEVRQDSMTSALLYSTLEAALGKLAEVSPATRSLSLVDAIVEQCIDG